MSDTGRGRVPVFPGARRQGVWRRQAIACVLGIAAFACSAEAQQFSEFSLGVGTSHPGSLTAGPDGNVWFTASNRSRIERITPGGAITEFPLPRVTPTGIAVGPDGNLWFVEVTQNPPKVGRMTLAGVLTQFPIPGSPCFSAGAKIVTGPDGALWFPEICSSKIARVTPAGITTEFATITPNSSPRGIAVGPDGNLWFTENNSNRVGRITTAGIVTEFPVPTPSSRPVGITSGPDGNLWFTESSKNRIGRVTPAGGMMEFVIPTLSSSPNEITAGSDGNLWFTESAGNKIGQITPAGVISEFPVPTADSNPYGIALGADGNVWFSEDLGNKVGKVTSGGVITEYPLSKGTTDPWQIVSGPGGALWIAEQIMNTIARVLPTGEVTDFATAAFAYPIALTVGPDNNVWFIDGSSYEFITRLTPSGTFTQFPDSGFVTNFGLMCLTAGPDGNLWFADSFSRNAIGYMTPAGVFSEFPPLPTANSMFFPAMTSGPDGNLWFLEDSAGKIGRITTAGVVTEFPVPTVGSLRGIVWGPDGNLWFTEYSGNKIGRITTAGVITEYPVPTSAAGPYGLTSAPDGNLWFVEVVAEQIGRITPAGVITEYPIPVSGPYTSFPDYIAAGPDGNLWFTKSETGNVGRLILPIGQDLASDAGFNANLASWGNVGSVTAAWSALDANGSLTSGSVAVTNTSSSPGRPALGSATPSSATGNGIEQACVAVVPSLQYDFGVKVRVPGGQGTTGLAGAVVTWYADATCTGPIGSAATPGISPIDMWQTTSLSNVAPPSNTAGAVLGLFVSKMTGGVPFQANFDDASLTRRCDSPTATVSGGGTVCGGASATIQASLTGTPPWSVSWSDGFVQSNVMTSPVSRSVSPVSTTPYSVTSIADGICAGVPAGIATVTVGGGPGGPTAAVSGTTTICAGASAMIQADLNGTPPWSLTWSDGLVQSGIMATPATRTVSPVITTPYSVTRMNDATCAGPSSGSETVTVTQDPSPPPVTAPPSVTVTQSLCSP